jgi:preprotein translocase subunit SecD
MKTIYSILVALMLFSPVALSLRPSHQETAKIIMKAADNRITQAALDESAAIIKNRLAGYCPGKCSVSTDISKMEIIITAPDAATAKAVSGLVSGKGSVEFRDADGKTGLGGKPGQGGNVIESATAGSDRILLTLKPEAAKIFADMTRKNLEKNITLAVDGKAIFSPKVKSVIDGGKIEVTGKFSAEELKFTAALLNNGELPCAFTVTQ